MVLTVEQQAILSERAARLRNELTEAQATIARLEARVAELEGASEWRDIASAPRLIEFLVIGMNQFGETEQWVAHWQGNRISRQFEAYKPTHWRPLPAPPTAQPRSAASEVAQ